MATNTDQDAVGVDIAIPYGSHAETCPVHAVRAWRERLGERGLASPSARSPPWSHAVHDTSGLGEGSGNEPAERVGGEEQTRVATADNDAGAPRGQGQFGRAENVSSIASPVT